MGGGDAGENGDDNHNGEGDGCEPVAPECGLDVSGLDEDGSDGEALDKHFDFACSDGAKVDTFCLGEVSQDSYIALPENEDGGDGPTDNVEGGRREVEEEFGLADDGEADKCAADEDFVNEGVEHPAEFAGDVESSCDGAVDDVGKAGDNEDYKSGIDERGFIEGVRGIEKHSEEVNGPDEPAKGKYVWNLF